MALLRLGGVALVLFLVGLLPWVDNYAHIFGFAFGFLLSYALLPFVSFGTYDKATKVILIWVCLFIVVVLCVGLLILFYVHPIYECSFCKYLNCIPLTVDFCENQDIVFKRPEYWHRCFLVVMCLKYCFTSHLKVIMTMARCAMLFFKLYKEPVEVLSCFVITKLVNEDLSAASLLQRTSIFTAVM